ncbi:hypothetical protein HYV82_03015 [Candidatus Woesearchaeota archaeon]|nr:hypothetical protein [Candidatus Woesearchaeota archaeon]
MSEMAFQRQVLNRLKSMEKMMDHVIEYIEDSKLSRDDRQALKAALKEEKEGKLLSKKQVFG